MATNRHNAAYSVLIAATMAMPVAAAFQQSDRAPAPQGRQLRTVTQESLAAAITEAKAAMARAPGSSYTIALPAGRFDISGTPRGGGSASIDLSRINACPGTLTITGEGKDQTTIITDDALVGIMGRRTSCVTIADLTMSRRKIEATQGKIVALARESVTLEIPRGFPEPTSLLSDVREEFSDGREVNRRWLRRFVDAPGGPQIDVAQPQVNWLSAAKVPGGTNRWRFAIPVTGAMPRFRVGDLIGVKSKSGRDAYRFTDGEKITFRSVRWMMETRGIFHRVDQVTIRNCSIAPPPPINGVRFAMASSSGGPQIGHPLQTAPTRGHVVVGNDFRATGDDALMFAHASGIVENNYLADTFALGIRIYESPGLRVGRNTAVRAPIERMADNSLEANERPDASRRRPARLR